MSLLNRDFTAQLPAKELVSDCYEDMFNGCSKLQYVKALFTTEPSEDTTGDWLSGVAASGTFVKSKDATWNVTGAHGIPGVIYFSRQVQSGTTYKRKSVEYV